MARSRYSARFRTSAAAVAALPVAGFLIAAANPSAPATTVLPGSKPAWAAPSADRGATPAGSQIDLRVFLAGQDPAGLAAYSRAVSDPNSSSYEHFMTPAQVEQTFGATHQQISAITGWLTSSGLRVTGTTNEYIAVHGTAAQAQKAFGTSFHQYADGGTTKRAPSSEAKIPASVASAVLGVTGLSQQVQQDHPATTASSAPYIGALPCSDYHGQKLATDLPDAYGRSAPWAVCGYTPAQVRGAYGVNRTGLTGRGVTVAVVDAYASPTMLADANEYASLHGDKPFRSGQYREVVTPNLWTEQSLCGDWSSEESLDVESVHGLAPDANVVYVGANSCFDTAGGGFAPNGGLLDSLAMIVDQHLADIVSNSWGELMHTLDANGNPVDMDPALIAAYEQVFMKGAAEGIGFYFSSGDCGADDPTTGCGAANASARAQLEYPTSDPWVTSVGGTSIAIGSHNNYLWETGWQTATTSLTTDRSAWINPPGDYLYGGGGGTSEDFAQPWYQSFVVPRSLSTHLMSGANTSPKRVGPDVAAYADPSTGFLFGQTQPLPDGTTGYGESRIGGTSLACPTFAGIEADAQQAEHRPIGFANPQLYFRSAFGLFRDVTDHPLGNTTLDIVRNGEATPALRTMGQGIEQHATRGYDNSTGVGSPTAAYLESFRWFR